MMFLFSHPRELAFSPKKFSSKYSNLCENKSGMVGEVVVKLNYKNNQLSFLTRIFRPLILKDFFFAFSHPFEAFQ